MNRQPLRDVPIEVINQALTASLRNLEQIAIEESMRQNPAYFTKKVISEDGLKTIKKINFNATQHTDAYCPITQEEFNNNEEILELPCKHYFSPLSILNWLHNEKAECPLCRYRFPYITISKNTYIRIRPINRENPTPRPIEMSNPIPRPIEMSNPIPRLIEISNPIPRPIEISNPIQRPIENTIIEISPAEISDTSSRQQNSTRRARRGQSSPSQITTFIMPFNIRRNNIRSIAHWRNTMNGVIQR